MSNNELINTCSLCKHFSGTLSVQDSVIMMMSWLLTNTHPECRLKSRRISDNQYFNWKNLLMFTNVYPTPFSPGWVWKVEFWPPRSVPFDRTLTNMLCYMKKDFADITKVSYQLTLKNYPGGQCNHTSPKKQRSHLLVEGVKSETPSMG